MSAPASANAIAMACPMPRVPPVQRACLPSSENILLSDDILDAMNVMYPKEMRKSVVTDVNGK